MKLFKICREKYSKSLQASGIPNRWNKKDEFVIYTAGSISLSTLEMIVHRSGINLIEPYKLLKITVKDEALVHSLNVNKLPKNWRTLDAYVHSQETGSQWYQEKKSLILKVPSAIIPEEYNYIINTSHPSFETNISLESANYYLWDKRLL